MSCRFYAHTSTTKGLPDGMLPKFVVLVVGMYGPKCVRVTFVHDVKIALFVVVVECVVCCLIPTYVNGIILISKEDSFLRCTQGLRH